MKILTTILNICTLAQSVSLPVMPDPRLTPGDVLDVTARGKDGQMEYAD